MGSKQIMIIQVRPPRQTRRSLELSVTDPGSGLAEKLISSPWGSLSHSDGKSVSYPSWFTLYSDDAERVGHHKAGQAHPINLGVG